MTSKTFPSAMEECCRFDKCCVNNCPLSIIKYESDSSDQQTKCTLPKSIRFKLGKKWNLPNQGLREREISAIKREAELSPEQKEIRKQRLLKCSPFIRLKQKGYAITRLPKDVSNSHGQNDIKPQNPCVETPASNSSEVEK